jgi:hypothetical protein
VSFAAITLCVASQLAFIVVVYFVIDSVRKILDSPRNHFRPPSEIHCQLLLYISYPVRMQNSGPQIVRQEAGICVYIVF